MVIIPKNNVQRTNLIVGNPYLWLRFNDSSGAALADSSGNGRNQTISGTITNFWKSGKIGNCGYFQSSATNKVTMPGSYFSESGTWCCWVKANWSVLIAGTSRLLNSDDSRGTNYEIRSIYSDYFYLIVANGVGGYNCNFGDLTAYNNQWVHIAFTWEYDSINTNTKGYINSVNILSSNKSVSGNIITPNVSLDIGFWSGGYFDGYVEDFLLYDSTLTDEQIALIYEFQK